MPTRLLLNPIRRRDHQDSNLGMGGSSEHILYEFFMSGDIHNGIVVLRLKQHPSGIYGALLL